jgi:hypothetical protein
MFRHEAARVHHAARRRGARAASGSACTASAVAPHRVRRLLRTVCAHGARARTSYLVDRERKAVLAARQAAQAPAPQVIDARSTVGYNSGPVLMNQLIGKDNPLRR